MQPALNGTRPRGGRGAVTASVTVLLIGAAVALLALAWPRRATPTPPTAPPADTAPPPTAGFAPPDSVANPIAVVTPDGDQDPAGESPPPTPAPNAPAPVPSPSTLALPEPSPQSRQLVEGLTGVNPLLQAAPDEAIAQWKDNHQLLVQQGAAAVPAIWEYLRKNTDVQFDRDGWQSLGYRSGREAMIDALLQIGGPEALAVTREALLVAEHPREIALLARSLETQAPEVHRAEVLAAARESLARATQGDPAERDIGPVFEVFEKYGGAEAVGDLEQAARQWRYYATLTLGQLPDGAGIPALVRLATEATTPSIPVLDTLASLSTRHPDAREALLEQVRANRIPDPTWPALVQALTGDEMQVADSVFDRVLSRVTGEEYSATHIGVGNQNFYWAPTVDSLTPEQIAQQTALIDEIQAAAGGNAAAAQALRQARAVLDRRLARIQAEAHAQRP